MALESEAASPSATDAAPVVLRATDVHIDYRTAIERGSIRDRLTSKRTTERTTNIQAVRGVSLDLHRGETLGVIGHNGSGKSTLMRGLAGLVPLRKGEVHAIARPTLLGINAALNPKLSGRRNLTLGCLAQGMSRDTVKEQIDELIEFTGLGDFIDIPMEAYSTGMKSRLSFTVATAITPEILLLDEALAGGDREFRDRATRRLDKVREDTGAVILVSHSMAIMRRMCSRIMWMSHGEVVATGPTDEILEAWESSRPEQVGERSFDRGARKRQFTEAVVAGGGRPLRTSAIDLPPQDFIVAGFPNCGSAATARQIHEAAGANVGRRTPKPGTGRFQADATRADFVPESRFYVDGLRNGHNFSGYALSRPKLTALHEWSPDARIIICTGAPLETLYAWFDEYRMVAERGDPPSHGAMQDPEFYRTCSLDDFYGFFGEKRLRHAEGVTNVIETFGADQVYLIDRPRQLREPEAAAQFLSTVIGCEIGVPTDAETTVPTIADADRDPESLPSDDLVDRLDALRVALDQATSQLSADQTFL